MPDDDEKTYGRTIVGGQHGSPRVMVALPFSNLEVSETGPEAELVRELAVVVAGLTRVVSELGRRVDLSEEEWVSELGELTERSATLAQALGPAPAEAVD